MGAPNGHVALADLFLQESLSRPLPTARTTAHCVHIGERPRPNLKAFRERLAIAPEMQYLVVVDFHF
jgi:hypothetical protein